MEKKLIVRDSEGERLHDIVTNAMKVDYNIKIGTVVITDLRIGSLPLGLTTRATLNLDSNVLEANATQWTITDDTGKPYFGHGSTFYLTIKSGNLLVHT